ncbi:antibiotic biosynthesis monooxygenase family protein [Stackebrandtia soli]|uniref:antibiotic biosynthesis monooxygenase family protein n=1 Tax=Stackebrandtia soli TaxID=1892856 RepID=UPI0039E774A7
MLVVNRFQVEPDDVDAFSTDATAALRALSACRGFLRGECGGSLDDPGTWILVTRWGTVGDYRRALSSYDVKLYATPLLARALPEASAFEINLAVVDGEIETRDSDRASATDRLRDRPLD